MKAAFASCWLAVLALVQPGGAAENEFTLGVRTTEPLTPQEQAKKFHLPPGFQIQLVASEPDINKPFNMAFDSIGRLWVTTSIEYPFAAPTNAPGRDRLMIFEDFGADGKARKVTEFAGGLNIPIGVYPFRGEDKRWKCVVWSIPNIWLMEDTDGDGKADKREVLYGPFDHTRDTHGNQASFRRGNDGWLYATHGFNNDSRVKGRDGHEIHLNSGNTYRMRLDGSRIEKWTHGQVNPFGLAFDPLGNLYSADCHSSPIYQLLRGAHYPSFGKPHDGLGFAPVTIQHSHGSTAICGITYISDPAWPAELQGNILIGNVMTSRINRDLIEWVGSTSKGHEMPDFLSTDDPWFRPVDLQWGPDGALYVADFYNRIIGHYEVPLTHPGRDRERGRIWRIVPPVGANVKRIKLISGVPGSPPDQATASRDALLNEFLSSNPVRQALAREELALLPNANEHGLLTQAAQGGWHFRQADEREGLMVSCLWLLQRAGQLDEKVLLNVLKDRDLAVRVHALRIVTERGLQAQAGRDALPRVRAVPDERVANGRPAGRPYQDQAEGERAPHLSASLHTALLAALQDTEPHVQRAAADALAVHPRFENVQPLLQLLSKSPSEDTHLRHTIRMALRDQFNDAAIFTKVAAHTWPEPDLKVIGEIALAVKSEGAALFLMKHEPKLGADAGLRVRVLEHVARHAPVAALDVLAETVQRQKADDQDFQLNLFQTVQQGFTQRGTALTPAIRQWGTGLARKLLAPSANNAATWGNTPLDGVRDTRNPWTFQERPCADGRKASLISSHPLGEQLTGALRSSPFPLPEKLSFYLSGHDGFPTAPLQKKNFVRLREASNGTVLREVSPPRNDTAQLITWDLSPWTGKSGYIEVVDADTATAYAWLALGRFEPALPQLALVDPNQTARRWKAGAELAQSLRLEDLQPRLTELLRNPGTDFAARASAASAVAALKGDGMLSALAGALNEQVVPEEVKRALTAAIAGDAAQSRAAVEVALQSASLRVQLNLAQKLAANPAGAELLLALAEAGKFAPRVLAERVVKDRLAATKPANWEARVAKLTANLPPADEARQKLIDERKAAFVSASADKDNGAVVFTQSCAVCHQLGGKGALVGPQLDGIGNRGLERLLEDILDPNRNVDHAFRSQIVVLKDGDVVSGLVRREEGAVLVMADATGKELQIEKTKIASRRESESSLMPENFHEALTAEQLRDLVGYLLGSSASSVSR